MKNLQKNIIILTTHVESVVLLERVKRLEWRGLDEKKVGLVHNMFESFILYNFEDSKRQIVQKNWQGLLKLT